MKQKECPSCTKIKSIDEFDSQKKYCLTCRNKISKVWAINNKEKNNLSKKRWRIRNIDKYRASQKRCAREHYKKNKSLYIAKNKARTKRIREEYVRWLIGYFEKNKCVDCGEDNPIVLTFDHIKGEKKFDISVAVSSARYSKEKIELEIKKCAVRCSNCHQKKTAREREFTMYKILKEGNSPYVL